MLKYALLIGVFLAVAACERDSLVEADGPNKDLARNAWVNNSAYEIGNTGWLYQNRGDYNRF